MVDVVVGVFFLVMADLQLCEYGFDEPPGLGDLAATEEPDQRQPLHQNSLFHPDPIREPWPWLPADGMGQREIVDPGPNVAETSEPDCR